MKTWKKWVLIILIFVFSMFLMSTLGLGTLGLIVGIIALIIAGNASYSILTVVTIVINVLLLGAVIKKITQIKKANKETNLLLPGLKISVLVLSLYLLLVIENTVEMGLDTHNTSSLFLGIFLISLFLGIFIGMILLVSMWIGDNKDHKK